MRGAFADTLVERGLRRIPMVFQHDPSEPVGIWLELREDHRGPLARGRLIPDVTCGRELLSLLRAGAIDGLSIGFRTAKARTDRPAHAHPSHLCGRTFGSLDRHVPDADECARAQREARVSSVAQLQSPQEPEVFHDPLLMMLANCIDVGDARVVFYRTCRYAPLFTDRPAFQAISTLRWCSRAARAPVAL